jgi:membrane-anchored protein YejM (alkaline phosphatase superfamily)
MQQEAPETFDLTKESDATHKLYGLERGSTQGFAWQCLVARRLADRGVRSELIDSGSDINKHWDAHFDIKTHVNLARNVDQPIAALLKDLKSRGMLEDTLVV